MLASLTAVREGIAYVPQREVESFFPDLLRASTGSAKLMWGLKRPRRRGPAVPWTHSGPALLFGVEVPGEVRFGVGRCAAPIGVKCPLRRRHVGSSRVSVRSRIRSGHGGAS